MLSESSLTSNAICLKSIRNPNNSSKHINWDNAELAVNYLLDVNYLFCLSKLVNALCNS